MSRSGLGVCPKCGADTGYDHVCVRGESVHVLVEDGEPRIVAWDSYELARWQLPYVCRACSAEFSREELLRMAVEQVVLEGQCPPS